MTGPANPFDTVVGPVPSSVRGRTPCSRTTRSWPSTRRCSTSGSSASPCHSPSPSACWRPAGWGTAGRSRPGAGPSWPGRCCRSASCSAHGGPTRCSDGGLLGWDPVENAALLPWLCGTAYLHSVLVQERRGLLRVWNLSLSVATFALTILGTFLTRSGVIQSVHSFSKSSLGPLLIGFFLVVVVVGFGLIAWRGDRMRSPGGLTRHSDGRAPSSSTTCSSSASPSWCS